MADRGLSAAQRDAARIVLDTLGSEGFRLAGGAAMVVTGLTARPTRDIDAFTDRVVDMPRLAERVKEALEAEGLEVSYRRAFPQFVTLHVAAGRRGQFDIDLGRDHFEWPAAPSPVGPTLSQRELAASKMLALFSRVQTRDLADVAALAERFDIEDVFADAKIKDPGFNRVILAEMIRLVLARPDPDWPVGVDISSVKAFGERLAASLEAESR